LYFHEGFTSSEHFAEWRLMTLPDVDIYITLLVVISVSVICIVAARPAACQRKPQPHSATVRPFQAQVGRLWKFPGKLLCVW